MTIEGQPPNNSMQRTALRAAADAERQAPLHAPLPVEVALNRLTLLAYPISGTLATCDPFGIPSTSHWTDAAIIVKA